MPVRKKDLLALFNLECLCKSTKITFLGAYFEMAAKASRLCGKKWQDGFSNTLGCNLDKKACLKKSIQNFDGTLFSDIRPCTISNERT